MDTKKLRQKILDLAIRGKLVPQDPNDEPASLLLERIRAEKERLIKKGKIKRSKKTATNDDIEAPFEIPESWEWVRLDDIAFITKLAGFEYTNYIADNLSRTTGIPLFKGKNVQDGKIVYEFESFIPKNISEVLPRSQVYKKCLLTPYVGTIGNIGIHEKEGFFHLGSNVGKIELFNDTKLNVLEEYVRYFLMSNDGYKELTKHKKATAQDSISIDAIRDCNVPLPPIKEQKRIITQIDYWLSQVTSIEENENGIVEFVDKAKSKILDLAIHGKLVPQDPNDEPAIELLKRINPKFEPCKNELDDTILPDSWCWARGTDIFKPMKSTQPSGETFKYIDIDAIDNKLNIITSVKVVNSKDAPSRASRYTEKGSVLFSMVRPYLRNIAMVPEENCIASTGFYVCKSKEFLDSSFCLYMMLSDYVVYGLNEHMKGDNSPSINKRHIDSFTFPLPPYQEQLRIVSKIEELFAVLDGIKETLA